jgi:two-component system NarL family response regulator
LFGLFEPSRELFYFPAIMAKGRNKMMRILLVDDHILVREGFESLLNSQPDFRVVGQAGSVAEAIVIARQLCPDLVLMDFGLPDGTGLDATQAILAEQPDIKIVFLTIHEEDDRLFAAIRSGAKGYLLKNVPGAKLLTFLRRTEQGEPAISPDMASRILTEFSRLEPRPKHEPSETDELTLRELEVLKELASGASNREIADHLVIAENTVKSHVRNILTKLHLRNRREATAFAHSQGLLNSLNHLQN